MTAPPNVHLTTDRLWLRRFTPDDAAALYALDRDPAVRRFVEDGTVPSLTEAADTISQWLATYPADGVFGFWAAVERISGDFVGWFHFRPPPGTEHHDPELGYRLVRSAWGRGLATEGSQALIDHGFRSGHVRRVVAETMAVHAASRRVMEKVGMRLVRTFHADWPVRIPGDEHGDVEYAITLEEWRAGRLRDASRRFWL
jgi:RimJ/RimL family protein N-acetyltransferase